ncbi:uncharacterized protein LOC144872326 [Branchiostoma floridae x Branchiostoma japonicum]
MQQLILTEYRTIRCNKVFDLSPESRSNRRRRGLVGRTRKDKGRQVLQEKIFARTKKKTAIPAVTKSTLPSIPGPRHRVQVDVDPNSGSRARDGPFLPHLPRPNRAARQSPNDFELHSIVEILNLKKKELHSLPEQKPDMVMARSHRSPPAKNMRIPKDLPMTIKSYRDGEGGDGTQILRPPRQIVVVVPSVALESPRKTVKQTQLVMVDGKASEQPQAPPIQGESFGRLTGKYLTRRPSQEHRAGHFNNFRQYLQRSKSRKAAPLAPAPIASTQDKKILNVSGRNNIPTLPVIPSIRSDEIKTVMSENGVVLNGEFPANLSGVSSEDTSSSIRSELGKVLSNSSSSKSSADNNNNSNSNIIRVKRISHPQQKMRRTKDRQGRDSGNESSDSLEGLKDGSTTEERSRPRWSPGQRRYVVDKSHIHQQMVSKNGYSVARRYFGEQDREKYRSGLPSVLQSDQDYLTRTINGNPNKGKSGNHIVYVQKTHSIRRRRESGDSATDAQMRYREPKRILGQVAGHRNHGNPPPSPVDTDFKVKPKRQVEYSRPDSGVATRNSDSTARTDSSGVHSEVRKQPAMKTPAIWDETFTMRVTEDESPSSESDTESMPKPITMISINQSEQQMPNSHHHHTTPSETTELYRGGYGRVHQDIDNRSLLSVPDTESLRANTPAPKVLSDADDTESTSTISVPKITMTCATPLPPRATPSITPPPSDGLRLFVSDIERVGGAINR